MHECTSCQILFEEYKFKIPFSSYGIRCVTFPEDVREIIQIMGWNTQSSATRKIELIEQNISRLLFLCDATSTIFCTWRHILQKSVLLLVVYGGLGTFKRSCDYSECLLLHNNSISIMLWRLCHKFLSQCSN